MTSKLLATVALLVAVAAEAPYYSNRPSAQAPAFNYPAPSPQYTQPVAVAPAPSPQYTQPVAVAPAPAPLYYSPYQTSSPAYHAPAPAYNAPAAPVNQYVQYPPTNNFPQPQPQYQSGYNYERPSIAPAFAQSQMQVNQSPQPAYIQPQIPVSVALRPQPALNQFPSSSQQGYAYNAPQQQPTLFASQQSAPQPYQQVAQQQYRQASVQSQPQINYVQPQFDSGSQLQQAVPTASSFNQQQYSGGLDSQVVHHVSNILAQSEADYAKSVGSYQRVSGVTLEGASPSVELSSYVQNTPLSSAAQSQSAPALQELARGSSQQSSSQSSSLNDVASASVLSSAGSSSGARSSYGLPSVVDNRSAPSQEQTNYNFVPTSQQSSAYGLPN